MGRLRLLWAALVAADGCESAPLPALVRRLHEAVTALEALPVRLSPGPRGASTGSSSLGGQLAALMQPFKLKLCRAPGERTLRDYSANVVLIEPLATLTAVEDFLWPRVRRAEAPAPVAPVAPVAVQAPAASASTSPRTRGATAADKGKAAAAPTPPAEKEKDVKGKGKAAATEGKAVGGGRVTRAAAAARSAAMAITGGGERARGKSRLKQKEQEEAEEEEMKEAPVEEEVPPLQHEEMDEADEEGMEGDEGMEEDMDDEEGAAQQVCHTPRREQRERVVM